MKKQKREKTPHSRRDLAPAVRRKRGEKRGAVGSPPAPRPQGSAPGGAGERGGKTGDALAREVVHGVETACYDNLPTQHPVMFCLCGKRVQGFNWEECGGEFDDHLKEVST